jgi:tetratricopeptide (TPR) repeat protein
MARVAAVIAATALAAAVDVASTSTWAQGRDKAPELGVIVMSDAQVLDDVARERGLDADAVTGALRFIMSLEPDLLVVSAGANLPKTSTTVGESRLSSVVQRLQDTIIWTGDLRRSAAGKAPIRLGPVTLSDAKGGRPEALSEIALLVKRNIRGDSPSPRAVAVRIGCLAASGSQAEGLVREFQSALAAAVDKALLMSAVAGAGGTGADGACEAPGSPRADGEAVVVGSLSEAEGKIDIQPSLSWRAQVAPLTVPLPRFQGSSADYLAQRREYYGSIARAISAYTGGECPLSAVVLGHERMSSSAEARVDTGSAIIKDGSCPFVALSLLQRGPDQPDAGLLYELGLAYQAIGNLPLAARSFESAIAKNADWPEAHRALASTLFEQQRFAEAMVQFETALRLKKLPDIHAKYAQAAFLTGDQAKAEEQIELAAIDPTEGQNSEVQLLAARLSVDLARSNRDHALDTYFPRAMQHVAYGLKNFPDNRAFVRAGKDLAAVAAVLGASADYTTVADEALTLVLENVRDDAEASLLRGRVRVQAALRTNERNLKSGIDDLQDASDRVSRSPEQAASNVELRVVDLDLAEALFLDAKFKNAGETARQFLSRNSSDEDGTSSYQPVARLLISAAEIMAGRPGPSQKMSVQLDDYIKPNQPWPALKLAIPTATGGMSIPVAIWSFTDFDHYVCTRVPSPLREDIRALSSRIQDALAPPAGQDKPTINPC